MAARQISVPYKLSVPYSEYSPPKLPGTMISLVCQGKIKASPKMKILTTLSIIKINHEDGRQPASLGKRADNQRAGLPYAI